MRVIRMEVIARYGVDEGQSNLPSDRREQMLLHDMHALDTEISELVRHRANACLPKDHSVFARTYFEPAAARAVTDLWIVDPKVRWPFCLLTRSSWKVLAPMLAHIVRELLASRLQTDVLEVNSRPTRITALKPTRAWCDPVILCVIMVMLTSLCWVGLGDSIRPWLYFYTPA